jgi:hypothetical protein
LARIASATAQQGSTQVVIQRSTYSYTRCGQFLTVSPLVAIFLEIVPYFYLKYIQLYMAVSPGGVYAKENVY